MTLAAVALKEGQNICLFNVQKVDVIQAPHTKYTACYLDNEYVYSISSAWLPYANGVVLLIALDFISFT